MTNGITTRRSAGALGLLLAWTASCSGGGSGGGSAAGLQLVQVSVSNGATWQINREIEFTFDDPIDFQSVSLNTINIRTPSGTPASGIFFFRPIDTNGDGTFDSQDPQRIVFQPNCPTLTDFSDAGLQPGGVTYDIIVVGASSGATNTVRSVTGKRLETTQQRRFATPVSLDPAAVFLDTVAGPPAPVVRPVGSTEEAATYIELGDDDTNRTYIEFDGQIFTPEVPGFAVPLNLYSDQGTKVAVVIEFNQPVSPEASNIDSSKLRLEFLNGSGVWEPLDTRVDLVANCTRSGGATVRLEPIGILPEGSSFRVAVLPGFQDVVGQTNLLSLTNFVVVPTVGETFQSLNPPEGRGDELLEEFQVGGGDIDSFEDPDALFETAAASWGGGTLTAGFEFPGTGGQNGTFDVVIEDGDTLFFDTTATAVVGGPGGVPTSVQNTVGGVLDVRDFIIEEGGLFRVQGPNAFTLNASGSVVIRGTLDASGFGAKDVATLDTGHQREIGGNGVGGGGRGGGANSVINASTPKGDDGFGAFQAQGAGGKGGESGYIGAGGVDQRRPGGGGGGKFAADVTYTFLFGSFAGQPVTYAAEQGGPGAPNTTGAVSGQIPAQGGLPGSGPFVTEDEFNDVFGVRPRVDYTDPNNPVLQSLIPGELFRLWAGDGGGGGGNAIPSASFPNEPWTIASDEKGGGGGGGGSGVRIRSIGPIVFGLNGELLAMGGGGATGENTNFLDHIGGSGGGGSGGHVMLETASYVDFTDTGANNVASGRAFISTDGGLGGAGAATGLVPPETSQGGKGGPGVIQLHVPNPVLATTEFFAPVPGDIRVPLGIAGDPIFLGDVTVPPAIPMVPSFGARSKAQSVWVSLGGADQDPGGGVDPITFFFGGTETDELSPDFGEVLSGAGEVVELPSILGPGPVGTAEVFIEGNGATLVISGSALNPLIFGTPVLDVYLRTPDLLKNFLLRLEETGGGGASQDFDVTAASYNDGDPAPVALRLTVGTAQGTLEDFANAFAGTEDFTLIPRFFRVVTDGAKDALADNASVGILFQATGANADGAPDESAILVDWTGDISDFNAVPAGEIQFFRFQVEFNLDTTGTGLTIDTEPITLDFLRVPFRF